MMKTNVILLATVAIGATSPTLGAALATPEIENVSLVRNANTHLVTISYDLSEDAIVTAQVFTNGVALPHAAYGNMGGKVHRVVKQGTGHQIWWNPPTREVDALVAGGGAEVKLSAWAKDDPPDYLAIDLLATNCWRFYVTAEDVPLGVTNRLYKSSKMLMRKIYAKNITWPAGISSDFMDGDKTYGTNVLHRPHYVTLTYNYYIGIYEMTYSQYRNASCYSSGGKTYTSDTDIGTITAGGNDFGVIPKDQKQAIYWPAPWLAPSDMRGYTPAYYWPKHGHKVPDTSGIALFRKRTGLNLDLPTEAEWEYACRAGESKNLYTGKRLTAANGAELAWSSDNWNQDPACPSNQLHEVGLLKPNAWGLYDMLGNGFEVCLDAMNNDNSGTDVVDFYHGADVTDPVGPAGSASYRRARRGGGIFDSTTSNYAKGMTYNSSRADTRANISYTVLYPATAFRFALPAVIP